MMDTQRVVLYGALFLVATFLWTSWQREHTPVHTPTQTVTTTVSASAPAADGSQASASATAASTTPAQVGVPSTAFNKTPTDRQLTIRTNVLALTIDRLGGQIIKAELLKHAQDLKTKQPFVLFNEEAATRYTALSGLTNLSKKPIFYSSPQRSYELSNGDKAMNVTLTWQGKGLRVQKIYHVNSDSYVVNVEYKVTNNSGRTWDGSMFTQISRIPPESKSGMFQISSYSGASISDPENKPYEKVSFKNMQKTPLKRVIKGGWAAMQEHYFLSAWIPPAQQSNHYYTKVNGELHTVGIVGPRLAVTNGTTATMSSKLYIGPEDTDSLAKIAPKLEYTVDYGFLSFIAFPIFWLLAKINSIVGNWGVAIILVTVLIKLAFYRLSAKSYRSMAHMRELQPKIEALKAKYGDDKQRMTQSMMELYKQEKVNPLGGCLPILVQIPVFIALYWVLLESVDLRHAPFVLWIHNLAAPDPYFVLPIIMGITMFVQQRLNPEPPDPTQAKVMMFLPVIFTGLFLYFPAGLVLYWIVNNMLSIGQQWAINLSFEKSHKNKKIKK